VLIILYLPHTLNTPADFIEVGLWAKGLICLFDEGMPLVELVPVRTCKSEGN